MGFTRNLQLFEIAGQVRELRLLAPARPITNVVFMGMGEPMANYREVWRAVETLNAPEGISMAARHITVPLRYLDYTGRQLVKP